MQGGGRPIANVAVAWATLLGVQLMLTACPRAKLQLFVLGISDGITSVEAVRLLLHYGAQVHLYADTSVPRFHPKVYHFENTEGLAFVGSSNLTRSGWLDNIELNAMLKGTSAGDALKYIRSLSASGKTVPIATDADVAAAINNGLLIDERVAPRLRRPRGSVSQAMQRRVVPIDPTVRAATLELYRRFEASGFVLYDDATSVRSFVTDLGKSEANRIMRRQQNPRAGTFQLNVSTSDIKDDDKRRFWDLATLGNGRVAKIRLRTHLTPPTGVITEMGIYPRSRGTRSLAELRLRIGSTDVQRRYFDNSITAESLVRLDRMEDGVFDVTFVRPVDPEYATLRSILRPKRGTHLVAYIVDEG